MVIDLIFPVRGDAIPTDHAYHLYAALTRVAPAFHDRDAGLRFMPLGGLPDAPGRLRLTDHTRLRLRCPDDRIRLALPLAGKQLDVEPDSERISVNDADWFGSLIASIAVDPVSYVPVRL